MSSTRIAAAGVAVVAAGLGLATSCLGEPPPPPQAADGEAPAPTGPRDMLVIGWQSDIGNLHPVVYETAQDGEILSNLAVPTLDAEFDCRIVPKPGLATSWTWSEDGTELTLKLRDDLSYADGKPVTAHDVAFAYELAGDPTVASPRIGYLEHMVEGWNPKVVDDHTLVFRFNGAYDRGTLLSEATVLLPTPRHVFADADRATLRTHPRSQSPLSYGPWSLALHEPNNRFVLEPNADFTGPDAARPRLRRVVFRILPEYRTRVQALENGEIDMMSGLEIEDADRLRKDHPEVRVLRRGYRFMDYVAWNLKNPLFQDVRVRKALAMAVDVDAMIKGLLTGEDGTVYARRAIGTITPELCDAYADDIQPLPYDLEAAKALLAEAGWTDTDGDGWVDRDGQTFSFTLSTNAGNKRRADAQILVQDYLKRLGVKVDLEKKESNTFFKNLRERDYEAAIAGWSAALFVDPSSFWASDTPEKPVVFNFTSYTNPEVDALIDRGLHTPEPAEAAPIWRELQSRIYEDQPYLFLFWRDDLVGVHERFQNVQVNLLSELQHLHEWEVPPDKVKYDL